LGLAFSPKYVQRGKFYVYYVNPAGDIVVARFTVSALPDVADPASEEILLTIPHPTYTNHYGGQLAFSPKDGYLYISTGDGGGGGDPFLNGQNPNVLLAKLLRVDVGRENGPYKIPTDNPFVGTPGYRPEIWALGLRNPWRFSFDRRKGDLYLADVGQNEREEIDFQPANTPGGQNYGWNVLEGTRCYVATPCTPPVDYVPPVTEYDHTQGCSVTGGYVYRGRTYPSLRGIYFFGDFCTGQVRGLQYDGSTWQTTILGGGGLNISAFGEDQPGNIYVADYYTGNLYRLEGD